MENAEAKMDTIIGYQMGNKEIFGQNETKGDLPFIRDESPVDKLRWQVATMALVEALLNLTECREKYQMI